MGRHSTGANGKSDPQEKMEMDRTYPREACKKHHGASTRKKRGEEVTPKIRGEEIWSQT